MLETSLVLGMTVMHLGVPVADLLAWGIVVAFVAAPVVALDDIRRQRLMKAAGKPAAAPEVPPAPASARPSDELGARPAVVPASARLSPAAQWQAVSRLVSSGAERAMAVARDQQAIRREIDSLDFTLENIRRELSGIMAMPMLASAECVHAPIRPRALAA